jgi:hypothetical protein
MIKETDELAHCVPQGFISRAGYATILIENNSPDSIVFMRRFLKDVAKRSALGSVIDKDVLPIRIHLAANRIDATLEMFRSSFEDWSDDRELRRVAERADLPEDVPTAFLDVMLIEPDIVFGAVVYQDRGRNFCSQTGARRCDNA